MCGIYLQFIFLCLIVNVWSYQNAEEDLKEQSILYGVALESNNITNCEQDLKLLIEGVKRREIWALNMLDSSGQEEDGYLYVNFMWMGSMSQCANNNINHTTETPLVISPYKVEFLSVMFKHNNTMQKQYRFPNNEYLQIGLCLPKSCSVEDISPLIERTVVKRQLLFLQNYPVQLSLFKIKSLSDENNDWVKHPMVILTLIILLVTLILTILGSYYDVCIYAPYLQECSNKKGKELKLSRWSHILLCYSFPANVRSLFNTNVKGDDSLPVIHGLKAIGMFCIVFLHLPLYLSMAMDNAGIIVNYSNVWYMQLPAKGAYSVDTYFCLGGFLISYAFYKAHKNKKAYTLLECIRVYGQMILHRIIRLLPSYIVTIGLVVTLWRYADKTYPLFRTLDNAEDTCPTYWWRNLLFITTWYRRSEMCITWTWYLSKDMQFYVVNCALLILSTKFPNIVLKFLKFLVVYSILQAGWLTYSMSYIHTTDDSMLNEVMYYSFSVRMAPYFVGVLAGYYFNKWNGRIPLSNRGYRIGWIICLVTFLYIIHGLQYPTRCSQKYITFYVSLSKCLWGSCIAWLIMACLSGQGGIINKFMSQRFWIPLSRVTFGVYLTNLIVINMFAYIGEKAIHFSMSDQIFGTFFGSTALCFIFGTLFCLLFESPFVKLFKLPMNSNKNRNKNVDNGTDIKSGRYSKLKDI